MPARPDPPGHESEDEVDDVVVSLLIYAYQTRSQRAGNRYPP